jgi:antitoxin ChpS
MVAIPPALLDELSVGADAAVDLSVKGGRLLVEPRQRPHYTLSELLGRCRSSGRRTKAEKEWLAGPAKGRELI